MCNCSPNPVTICTQCQSGNPCACPPDYSVSPQTVPCTCCPGGYTFFDATTNWPLGYCQFTDSRGNVTQVAPSPCSSCAETISSDCVILPAIPCLGLLAGTTVSQLAAFLCSPAFISTILSTIGLNSTLQTAFCQLVGVCPPAGTTVPTNLKIGVYCCPPNCGTWLAPSPGFPVGSCSGCPSVTPVLCT